MPAGKTSEIRTRIDFNSLLFQNQLVRNVHRDSRRLKWKSCKESFWSSSVSTSGVCRLGLSNPTPIPLITISSASELFRFEMNPVDPNWNFDFSPISLTQIKDKLDPSHQLHYKEIPAFIADAKKLFNNAYLFYQVWLASSLNLKHFINKPFFPRRTQKSISALVVWSDSSNNNWQNGSQSIKTVTVSATILSWIRWNVFEAWNKH